MEFGDAADDEHDVASEPGDVGGVLFRFEGVVDGAGCGFGRGDEGAGEWEAEGHFGVHEAGFDGEDVDVGFEEAVSEALQVGGHGRF